MIACFNLNAAVYVSVDNISPGFKGKKLVLKLLQDRFFLLWTVYKVQ